MSQEDNRTYLRLPVPSSTLVPTATTTPPSLKRAASPSFEGLAERGRKRLREESTKGCPGPSAIGLVSTSFDVIDELAQELQCGCCSALVYRPVLVEPCQHFFCGSCCVLWIRNGGTNCPSCRGQSTIVTPFRAIKPILDLIVRVAPHLQRTENERKQADITYKAGSPMRLPIPREPSPEPNLNRSVDLAHPCPTCPQGNPFEWTCPQPIPDPTSDPDRAWYLSNGTPPGHTNCGNCESLMALTAPMTTKCDFCYVYFCGISIPQRCVAALLLAQHLHNMADTSDLVSSTGLYESFNNNPVEADYLLDYMRAQRLTPRHIYREIIANIQSRPRGFAVLADLFPDVREDSTEDRPRRRICRLCAVEVFLWGLKDWWVRERRKGYVEPSVVNRKDCPEGRNCSREADYAHAKEFNHVFTPIGDEEDTSTIVRRIVSRDSPDDGGDLTDEHIEDIANDRRSVSNTDDETVSRLGTPLLPLFVDPQAPSENQNHFSRGLY